MTETPGVQIVLGRPPVTPDELWWFVRAQWGVTISRLKVCPNHVSPFDAFCEGYFGNWANWVLWYGSRGTGKSYMLAILGLTKAVCLDSEVVILGGSMAQSNNVHIHVGNLMRSPNAPKHVIAKDIKTELGFMLGNSVKPIPASQTTVRGPHPQTLLLDEIDEMEKDIYDAAQGQPLAKPNAKDYVIPEMTVASSTWQNPVGCMVLGTQIATSTGYRRIEDIVAGDQVMTRHGMRYVTGSWDMGLQPTVEVTFGSGRRISCTPWHPIWTDSHGWVRADSLTPGLHVGAALVAVTPPFGVPTLALRTAKSAPTPVLRVGSEDAVDGQVMPVLAQEADRPLVQSASGVHPIGDDFEVARVHAGLDPAQVVNSQPGRNEPIDLDPDPAMGRQDSGLHGPIGLGPVAVGHDVERPQDAVIGVQVDGMTFTKDEVVHVSHVPIVLPTWDLTVEGAHEYIANDMLVHNTFQEVRDDALIKGLPVRTWCWREVLKTPENPYGWMPPDFIERKKASVPAEMFRVEYDMGEPSGSSRAFDIAKLERVFIDMPIVDEHHKANDDMWTFAEPSPFGTYCAGADWAKEEDKTVIVVFRTDIEPARMVYLRVINRRAWPDMVEMFNQTIIRYHASAAHDATGVGNVVNDLVDDRVLKVVMIDQKRRDLLNEYVADFESMHYLMARNSKAYDQHRATTMGMIWAGAHGAGEHLPDITAACAIANRARRRMPPPAGGQEVKVTPDPPKAYKGVVDSYKAVSDVRVAQHDEEVGVMWL